MEQSCHRKDQDGIKQKRKKKMYSSNCDWQAGWEKGIVQTGIWLVDIVTEHSGHTVFVWADVY